MAERHGQACKEWFEDSELDAHLNEHIGLKDNLDFDDDLTKRRPGRRGEFLGGASALLGFVTAFVEILLLGGFPPCTDPCPGPSLSTEFFVLFSFCGSILGLIGASTVGRHWRAGSFALLTGGVLPLISWTGTGLTSNFDYGPPSFFFISFFFSLLIFVGWAPLVIIAGALALSDSPRKRANQHSRVGFPKKTI